MRGHCWGPCPTAQVGAAGLGMSPRLPSKFPDQSHRRCSGHRELCFHGDSWAVLYPLTLTPCEAVLFDTDSQTRVLTRGRSK